MSDEPIVFSDVTPEVEPQGEIVPVLSRDEVAQLLQEQETKLAARFAAQQLQQEPRTVYVQPAQVDVDQEPEYDYTDMEGSTRRLAAYEAQKIAERIIAEKFGNMPDPNAIAQGAVAKIEARNVVSSYEGKVDPATLAEIRQQVEQMPANANLPQLVKTALNAAAYEYMEKQQQSVPTVDRSRPAVAPVQNDQLQAQVNAIPVNIQRELANAYRETFGKDIDRASMLRMYDNYESVTMRGW